MPVDFLACFPLGLGTAVVFESAHAQNTLDSQIEAVCKKRVEAGQTGLANQCGGSWMRSSPVVLTSRGDFGTRTK